MKNILQLGFYFFLGAIICQNAFAQGDNCSNAEEITSLPFQDSGSTDGFSDDYDASCNQGDPFAPDVVYKYTPSSTGFINISLCETGSTTNFDTEMWVYEGTCTNPNEIACSDDACNNPGVFNNALISRITNLPVTAGETYFIVIGGFSEFEFGNYTLDVTEALPAAGTNCSNPLVVNTLPFSDAQNTASFGDEIDMTSCSSNNLIAGDEVVYTYTPTSNEFVDIQVSNISTTGAVMITDNCPDAVGAQCVAEVFGAGSSTELNITSLELTGGQTYYIVISSFPSPQSTDYILNISQGSAPPTGSTCDDPVVIASIPFQDVGQTTVGFGDDYDSSICSPSGTDYLGGDEIVYTFTATEDRTIGMLLTNIGADFTSIHVLDACPDVATSCVAFAANTNSRDDLEVNVNVQTGTTYYILVSTWPNPQSTSFDLFLEEPSGVNISVSPSEGSESDQTVFTITANSASAVSSDQTVDVQVIGTGITLADFVLSAPRITIPTGQSSGSITLTVQDDAIGEGTETAIVRLANPSAGITLGNFFQESITILDNDNLVNLSLSTGSISENASGGTVTLTATATEPISGNQHLDVIFDGAGIDNDFSLSGTQFLFTDGMQSAELTLALNNDVFDEGDETVTFRLRNPSALIGIGEDSTQSLEILNDDFAPVSQADGYTLDEDQELVVDAPGILENDTDADLDVIFANLIETVSQGTLELQADGTFRYTPAQDFHGTDTFTYQADDGFNTSNTSTVTIQVNPVNDTPRVERNLTLSVVPEANQVPVGQESLWVSDVEDAPENITFQITGLPTQGVIALEGTTLGLNDTFTQEDINQNRLTYSHQGAATGFDGFTSIVQDSDGLQTDEITFFVRIDLVSGDEDALLTQSTRIYPNPGTESFVLELNNSLRGKVHLSILSGTGMYMYHWESTKNTTVFEHRMNATQLAAGVYLVVLEVDQRSAYFRWIKK